MKNDLNLVAKMVLVIFVCGCLVLVRADLREVKISEYKPPSQEEILSAYFEGTESNENNRTKKSVANVADKVYKELEPLEVGLATNLSNTFEEDVSANSTVGPSSFLQETTQVYLKEAPLTRNYIYTPIEATTYRYPTAVWSSQAYERLKNSQRYRSRPHFLRPSVNTDYVFIGRGNNVTSELSQRRSRGRMKWQDYQIPESFQSFQNSHLYDYGEKVGKSDLVDRFLEHSLSKYLASSNLKETVGNVSVKTFSEILRNITDPKAKRLPSPYDENKELRMKFREEVILKKKNDTKPSGKFLEKQLQKRLEKVSDVFNERNKDKILANMWKYVALNRTESAPDEKKLKTPSESSSTMDPTQVLDVVTPEPYNPDLIYLTTKSAASETKFTVRRNRGSVRYGKNVGKDDDRNNLLKLTAEESSYYRKGLFPSLTFIGQHPEKPGVIPGRPHVDYPVHRFPPPTKFKCPKFKGGKPKMMADKETRCQVFYICTGDGPTTAMLCPNGTMFNENFLVCDWWYNVSC